MRLLPVHEAMAVGGALQRALQRLHGNGVHLSVSLQPDHSSGKD